MADLTNLERLELWSYLGQGIPLTGNAIYNAVYRRTKEAFGEPVNLHLFRDGAATFWALKDPARVAAMSGLLGHEPRMTERHYNQANGIRAGRKLADALALQMCPDPAHGNPAHE